MTQVMNIMSDLPHLQEHSRTLIYSRGISGHNFDENNDHHIYARLAATAVEITVISQLETAAIFSAYWQVGANKIKVSVAEQVDIIDDFYCFLLHYHEC